ncbi:hypothetical protein TNCV_1740071 [Trichonephila clavipes]|nr:hypothetical protein TNCV_1740071 [Trichonephila clavipes]
MLQPSSVPSVIYLGIWLAKRASIPISDNMMWSDCGYLFHATNREVTHSVPPTNHSACFPRPVHSNKSWFPHQTPMSTPPPTSYYHVIYYVTPASQSGRCLLPIKSTPFKPIKGSKNNRKSPSPQPESASKKLKITEVESTNRFSNLQIEDPPIIEDEQEERDEDIPQPKPPRFRPPPPITIDNVNNSAAFLKQFQNMTQENLMGRIIGKGLRVYPKTPQAYHKIRSFIDHEKLESYTYQLNEEKELKVVIRGMPSDMPPQ